jgi:hypothetical protein
MKKTTTKRGYGRLINKINNEKFLPYSFLLIAPFSIGSAITLLFNLTSHKLLFQILLNLGFFLGVMSNAVVKRTKNSKIPK